MRQIGKKHLGKHPPDLRVEAVKLVSEQAEELCAEWAET